MFNKNQKIALVLIGAEFIIGSAVAIYSYGQYKYYEGRISKSEELAREFEKIRDKLNNKINKDEA